MANLRQVKLPHQCENKAEVRDEIDAIDLEIIKLFGIRFQYVKEIVKFKEKTPESIVAAKRQQIVIQKRREWAFENGIEPDIIEQIYRKLIQYFINEELQIVNLQQDNKTNKHV